ncbi:TPA: hypothetical protein DCR49_11915 [Candidatus Delongbacteria bacterium]|nr:MAG: hypothetical protein A2Y39_02530 [Candidatus Delongbacteria bacterium GWF2_40_14]HAQ62678.1 hypothetical protein [Candidatus Delongbacteria bacterium]
MLFISDEIHQDITFTDGEQFGEEGRGFMRLNFACPKSTLVESLNRLKKFFVNSFHKSPIISK